MNSLNYVDLVVFIILLIEVIKGIRSGIIVPLFDIAGIVLGWFIAKANSVNFAPFVDKSLHITPYLLSKVGSAVKLPEIIGSAPATKQSITAAFSTLHLPAFIQNFLLHNIPVEQTMTVQQYVVHSISYSILVGISFLILFIIVLLIFRIAGVLIRKGIRVSPFLKWVDAVFGALFKFLIAFTVLYIIADVIVISAGYLSAGNSGFIYQVEYSKFFKAGSAIMPFLKGKVIQIITPLIK